MSAAGVTTCPACHGLMGAGAWLCGPCWEALTPIEQQRASMSPQARREIIDRAYDRNKAHPRKGHR